jgi:hypothetical protein
MLPVLRSALVLSAVTIAAAACNDGTKPVPTAPVRSPGGINASLTLACDFPTLRNNARAYVASYNSDAISDIISSMQGAANATVRTSLGFDGLAQLAAIRGDADRKKADATPLQGAEVVKSFLGCMNVGAIPDAFALDIVNAMGSGGMFEVPTGNAPVYSRGETPFWGAQPETGSTWASSTNKRFLMYGFKIQYDNDNGILDPVLNKATPLTLNGFDYKTLPVIGTANTSLAAFNPQVTIGICDIAAPSSARIYHSGAVLAGKTLTCASPAPVLASAEAPVGGFTSVAWLARKALGVFTPQPLNATALVVGIAGGRGELSPTAAVVASISATFLSQPTNGFVKKPIPGTEGPVSVLVKSDNGYLYRNIQVTISVANTSGTNVAASGAVATTGDDGIALFPDLTVNKAGGYTLTASTSLDAGLAGSKVSVLFNVQNK